MDWEQKNTIRKMDAGTEKSLPRVLILGDSISLGYTPFVVEKMKGKAFVTRPEDNCGPSEFYLRSAGNIQKWLRDSTWDVIHVNFGIWDHHFVNEKGEIFFFEEHSEALTALAPAERIRTIEKMGYHLRTSPAAYAANTREILADLKKYAKNVIFASSTPVPLYETLYKNGNCIPEYNAIADAVCRELDVPVNDLYSPALPLRDDQQDGCHFSAYGYNILADAVVGKVSACLKA